MPPGPGVPPGVPGVVAPPVVHVGGVAPPPLAGRLDWPRCETDLAVFTLDPYSGSIGCHCKHPAHQGSNRPCVANRVATKQPAGYFLAWLLAAHGFPNRDTHFAARLFKFATPEQLDIAGYAKRCEGRAFAMAHPEYRLLLEWELPRTEVEALHP